ncbi:MAG: hypothetical protein AUH30_04550 [Candidatus Rokubacteria bacterium 13_1_40CM_68_15]|nr:MAG: hypothetical protein AUH30_04550 [Candidatus Rokubacteria bacterium 13_1_40CM_68_15]
MNENAGGIPDGQATLPKVLVGDDHGDEGSLRWLMGSSGLVQDVIEQIREVADSNLRILIQGETGTGKELVARAIHQMSSRRDKPFVALDCGATPETLIEAELFGYEKGAFSGAHRRKNGYFHLAERGSLFFDEIANLPSTIQAKLIRVLQEHRVQRLGGRRAAAVDVRILAAYSAPLVDDIRVGRFRQDLYYRLREFVIILPPLRERPEDIPHLAERFLIETSVELRRPARGISDEAFELLRRYSWPGNVRELRNVIRQAVVLSSDLIQPTHLAGLFPERSRTPATSPDPTPPDGLSLKQIAETAAAEAESRAIRRTLQATRGKKSEAARLLKVDYKTLHLKMKRYRIYARDFMV